MSAVTSHLLRCASCPALSEEMVESLRRLGIRTVLDFLSCNLEEISQKIKTSYMDLVRLRRLLVTQNSAFPVSAADLYEDYITSVALLSTGIDSIDGLLDGGVYTAELTEIVGSPASGKSQVCMSTAVSVAHGMQQMVVYVDSGGAMDCQCLLRLMQERGVQEQEVKDVASRIQCRKVYNIFDLLKCLASLRTELTQQQSTLSSRLKLIIVDSIASLVSPTLTEHHCDGHGLMMQVASTLKGLAVDHSVAVLVTNNIVAAAGFAGTKPALGATWLGVPDTRIQLQAGPPRQEAGILLPGATTSAILTKSCRNKCFSSVHFHL